MSKFVNYKKRSIELPSGCKDLIDVLRRNAGLERLDNIPAGNGFHGVFPGVICGGFFEGHLSDIGKYVAMVFDSRALAFFLIVNPPDGGVTLTVYRGEDGTTHASLEVQVGTEREKAVRSFLAPRGLHIPDDSGMPSQFASALPVYRFCDLLPLAPEAPLLSKLVEELFRRAFGLSDDSKLCFRYQEMTSPL